MTPAFASTHVWACVRGYMCEFSEQDLFALVSNIT